MRNAKYSCLRSLHVSDCFVILVHLVAFIYSYAYKYIMKKYLKLRKHTFKKIHKFFKSVADKPVFNEGLVFSNKLFHVS